MREEREAGKGWGPNFKIESTDGGEFLFLFLFRDGRPHGGQHKVPAENQV